jgi:hypothetical protein
MLEEIVWSTHEKVNKLGLDTNISKTSDFRFRVSCIDQEMECKKKNKSYNQQENLPFTVLEVPSKDYRSI